MIFLNFLRWQLPRILPRYDKQAIPKSWYSALLTFFLAQYMSASRIVRYNVSYLSSILSCTSIISHSTKILRIVSVSWGELGNMVSPELFSVASEKWKCITNLTNLLIVISIAKTYYLIKYFCMPLIANLLVQLDYLRVAILAVMDWKSSL